MVKALTFKGDKKVKKRKRPATDADEDGTTANKQLALHNDAPPEDDDNWVSALAVTDLAGPVMLVLPSEPASCMAVDQLGTVFTSRIENMIENEPSTAEPHDVRQVWISQKIVGMENSFTFKGHHGKYLGCDKYGILSASREAVSPEETFLVVPSDDYPEQFEIQTTRSTYLSVDSDKTPAEVRGDSEKTSETTHIRVRMQARFKPKHKAEKAEKIRAKISRKELEDAVGRRLDDDEVKMLKKARREGDYHEALLDVKVKGKHDKFA